MVTPPVLVTFRRLTRADLRMLATWLNKAHMRAHFQKTPISEDEVIAKYGARIDGWSPTQCHMALLDGEPFGYLQCYRVADYPDWAKLIGAETGIGIDLAIGEAALIGKGLGRAMLAGYLDVAFGLFPHETRCYIAHEDTNHAAIACSKSVGLAPLRSIVENGLHSQLLVIERGNAAR